MRLKDIPIRFGKPRNFHGKRIALSLGALVALFAVHCTEHPTEMAQAAAAAPKPWP